MATNFPASLDSYAVKGSGDTIAESHINDPQDAIEAIEEKIGTGVAGTIAQSAATNTALLGYGNSLTGYAVINLGNSTLVTGTLTAARGGTGLTNSNTAGSFVALDAVPSVPTKFGGTSADLSAAAQGAVVYFSATGTMTSLAAGTANYVLKATGAASNPLWTQPAFAATVLYTGNNTDDRDIPHTLGRVPVYVRIASHSASTESCYWMRGFGTKSKTDNGSVGDNGIQSVDATNVQIGTDSSVNQNGASYTLFAI